MKVRAIVENHLGQGAMVDGIEAKNKFDGARKAITQISDNEFFKDTHIFRIEIFEIIEPKPEPPIPAMQGNLF